MAVNGLDLAPDHGNALCKLKPLPVTGGVFVGDHAATFMSRTPRSGHGPLLSIRCANSICPLYARDVEATAAACALDIDRKPARGGRDSILNLGVSPKGRRASRRRPAVEPPNP